MTATPYSVVTSGGVRNKRTQQSSDDATLEDLFREHSKPVQLPLTAIEYHNAGKKERSAAKMELPYFVGAVLSPRTRADEHVTERTLLTLDVEEGRPGKEQPPPPEDVVAALEDLGAEGWVYTSLSHTPDRPRYRVVLPLGKPIRGDAMQEALEASTKAAAEKLGLDQWCQPESWVLSQPMYLPAKLRGGTFYQQHVPGRAWRTVQAIPDKLEGVKDIPDEVHQDLVLRALRSAGLYIRENPKHPGMHFIKCPFIDQHGQENDTQTVYYEAHYDGNPRAAVKCFDTEPDQDGHPHLTYSILVRWLKENDHLTDDQVAEAGVLEDLEAFAQASSLSALLARPPAPREWAVPQFAPRGTVTVLAGPGGQGKSLLTLHLAAFAAAGRPWANFKIEQPIRTLCVSYEDGLPELYPRLKDITDHLVAEDPTFAKLHDVQGMLEANLRVYPIDTDCMTWMLMEKAERFGAAERTDRVQWLIDYLKHDQVDMLILDPMVYTHGLEENDVADMAAYMRTLNHVAKEANCAVVVIHHMNKAGSWGLLADINPTSLRGASSVSDNARSVGVMVSMPAKDAPSYGLDEDTASKDYAVFKHVKHNYSAPLEMMVFLREGRLLIPRQEVRKMSKAQIDMATETLKEEQSQARLGAYAPKLLQVLVDHKGPLSQAQIAQELGVKPTRAKQIIDWCVDSDLVDQEQASGARCCTASRRRARPT